MEVLAYPTVLVCAKCRFILHVDLQAHQAYPRAIARCFNPDCSQVNQIGEVPITRLVLDEA